MKKSLEGLPVKLRGLMYELRKLANGKCNVRTSKVEALETTNELSKHGSISWRRTIMKGQGIRGGHWGADLLSAIHTSYS
ncbi:unnamed protein product [Prunus armeniaca]